MILGGTGANAVKVGIGTSSPTAELHVNGYTKLGLNAPAVQMLLLSGTTAALQGGTVVIPHGLPPGRICGVNIVLDSGGAGYYPPNYTFSPGYEYQYYFDGSGIIIKNTAANSSNVLSKSVTVQVTYFQ
jgi:hypothetical protein